MKTSGKLYICATPIGNLEDVTLRALRVLKEVDLIAAEDTRETRKLLTRYQIKTPLTSYHKHNEVAKGKALLKKLVEGEKIALVSEAGMPGISDPGQRLIKNCLEEGVNLEVLPGPSAAISALVISGLPTDTFTYLGFLPRKNGPRKRLLQKFAAEERTLVVYESPHRLKASLEEVLKVLENRKIAVVRELTKKFEETVRGKVSEVLKKISQRKVRGEIVVVIEGKKLNQKFSPADLKKEVLKVMEKGIPKKEALRKVAQEKGVSKHQVYEAVKDLPAHTD